MTARGTLRIYLGAAPGVGKTFDMLDEGRRRLERGTDVVIGFVETHGRPRTAERIGNLPVVPGCGLRSSRRGMRLVLLCVHGHGPKVLLLKKSGLSDPSGPGL